MDGVDTARRRRVAEVALSGLLRPWHPAVVVVTRTALSPRLFF